ncbi:hypothetical protein ACFQ08_02415 [Streptosporangium algeriense]|uniref:Uncharacterized protein n=1 Tax=Streptosporangium algeriense TaxID=1682748 RepID=A0ABW3DHN1_9ACTN
MATGRRCQHCRGPLRATARADALYCSPACRAAAARRRRRYAAMVRAGKALVSGHADAVMRACPVCGKGIIPGVLRRADAVYDRPACRTAAWRARRGVREAVTGEAVRDGSAYG